MLASSRAAHLDFFFGGAARHGPREASPGSEPRRDAQPRLLLSRRRPHSRSMALTSTLRPNVPTPAIIVNASTRLRITAPAMEDGVSARPSRRSRWVAERLGDL
jgi:hypothetical protein